MVKKDDEDGGWSRSSRRRRRRKEGLGPDSLRKSPSSSQMFQPRRETLRVPVNFSLPFLLFFFTKSSAPTHLLLLDQHFLENSSFQNVPNLFKLWGENRQKRRKISKLSWRIGFFAYKFYFFRKLQPCLLWAFLSPFTWKFQNSRFSKCFWVIG